MLKRIIIFISILSYFISARAQVKQNLLAKDTITDHAIQVPIDLDRNFEQLIVSWNKSKRKIPICTKLNEADIIYPDSVYINRLHALPAEMELAYNQIVRSYIDMYAGRRRSSVEYMLAARKYYNPIIENILDKYGLPIELRNLPIIESALNPVVRSRAGATGLWQFMLSTGKQYDLEINSLVDQRCNPVLATDAAARYLKDLYNIFGDWNLVIAAYNCGPGNVLKAIRRSGQKADYWVIYPYLPRETRGYVPAFIGATYIMNYYQKHNICPADNERLPMSTDTVRVNYRVHLKQIAEVIKIPLEDLETLNPQFRKDIIPGDFKSYTLTLPSDKISDFISHKSEIVAYHPEELLPNRKTVEAAGAERNQNERISHKVRKGESLASIARKYDVSSYQIKKWNRLRSSHVSPGRRLTIYIPIQSETKKEPDASIKPTTKSNVADTASTRPDSSKAIYHKVTSGETMNLIARHYDVDIRDIEKWNNLPSIVAVVGQRLLIYIPQKRLDLIKEDELKQEKNSADRDSEIQQIPKTSKKVVYKVKKGDLLSTIAKRHQVTVTELKRANHLRGNHILVGQKLIIPQN